MVLAYRKIRWGVFLIACFALVACGNRSALPAYPNTPPELLLETFFNGRLVADGIVKNRQGKMIRYFSATIDASWDEQGIGYLDEQFKFNDGEQQQRKWRLEPLANGLYRASANDVVASENMQLAGNTMRLVYVLTLPYKGRDIDIKVDDMMYLVTPNLLINESTLTKFGFRLGSITLAIRKLDSKVESLH